MLNRLNTPLKDCTTADKFSSAFFVRMAYLSKEDKILIKNLRQLKGYTAIPVFLENSEPKTGEEHKF